MNIKIMNIYGALLCASLSATLAPQMQPYPSAQSRPQKVIVFDLGGILAQHDEKIIKKRIVSRTGLFRIAFDAIRHLGSGYKREIIRQAVFDILEEAAVTLYPRNMQRMCDEQGHEVPAGLCALHAGLVTCDELLKKARVVFEQWIEEDKEQGTRHFKSATQRTLIWNSLEAICDKTTLAESFRPIPAGCAFLELVASTPHLRPMILSNFAPEQFEVLRTVPSMSALFSYFEPDDILVSGTMCCLGNTEKLAPKPNQSTFYALKVHAFLKYGITNPADIIFIDNQPENVYAAQEVGISAYLVNATSECTENICNFSFEEFADFLGDQGVWDTTAPEIYPQTDLTSIKI